MSGSHDSASPVAHVASIVGPVATCRINEAAKDLMMNEIVFVSEDRFFGEITDLKGDMAKVQVYEETTMVRRGTPVFRSGELLSATLGPGLLGQIYDGLQRPLEAIREKTGPYLQPGVKASRISKTKRWRFKPELEAGQIVEPGDILGTVLENELVSIKIMVPPHLSGTVARIAEEADYTVEDEIARIRAGDAT